MAEGRTTPDEIGQASRASERRKQPGCGCAHESNPGAGARLGGAPRRNLREPFDDLVARRHALLDQQCQQTLEDSFVPFDERL